MKKCILCGREAEQLTETKYNGRNIKICDICSFNFEKLNDKGNIKGICEAINYFKKLMSENHE